MIVTKTKKLSNNTVMIDYDVTKNPVIPDFSLRFTFPDDMDQRAVNYVIFYDQQAMRAAELFYIFSLQESTFFIT